MSKLPLCYVIPRFNLNELQAMTLEITNTYLQISIVNSTFIDI